MFGNFHSCALSLDIVTERSAWAFHSPVNFSATRSSPRLALLCSAELCLFILINISCFENTLHLCPNPREPDSVGINLYCN